MFNAGYDVSMTHELFNQQRVLEPCATEPVRESDNRKWSGAAGDRRAVDCVRRNLSGNNRSPSVAELLAQELMHCVYRVHLRRTWKVLSFGPDGFRRRIPEINHHLALAPWIVLIRA